MMYETCTMEHVYEFSTASQPVWKPESGKQKQQSYPDAPCMEYLPTFTTFTHKMAQMQVDIPYMEHLGYIIIQDTLWRHNRMSQFFFFGWLPITSKRPWATQGILRWATHWVLRWAKTKWLETGYIQPI